MRAFAEVEGADAGRQRSAVVAHRLSRIRSEAMRAPDISTSTTVAPVRSTGFGIRRHGALFECRVGEVHRSVEIEARGDGCRALRAGEAGSNSGGRSGSLIRGAGEGDSVVRAMLRGYGLTRTPAWPLPWRRQRRLCEGSADLRGECGSATARGGADPRTLEGRASIRHHRELSEERRIPRVCSVEPSGAGPSQPQ